MYPIQREVLATSCAKGEIGGGLFIADINIITTFAKGNPAIREVEKHGGVRTNERKEMKKNLLKVAIFAAAMLALGSAVTSCTKEDKKVEKAGGIETNDPVMPQYDPPSPDFKAEGEWVGDKIAATALFNGAIMTIPKEMEAYKDKLPIKGFTLNEDKSFTCKGVEAALEPKWERKDATIVLSVNKDKAKSVIDEIHQNKSTDKMAMAKALLLGYLSEGMTFDIHGLQLHLPVDFRAAKKKLDGLIKMHEDILGKVKKSLEAEKAKDKADQDAAKIKELEGQVQALDGMLAGMNERAKGLNEAIQQLMPTEEDKFAVVFSHQ